jgi:hypothetical protein
MALTRKPRAGDRIGFGDFCGPGHGSVATVRDAASATHTVTRVEDNLCWIREDGKPDEPRFASPFIWNFPADGQMNRIAKIFDKETP